MQKYTIDSEIYEIALLKRAIEDYSEVSKIEYKKWELIIHEEERQGQEIFLEFMNYCLSLTAET